MQRLKRCVYRILLCHGKDDEGAVSARPAATFGCRQDSLENLIRVAKEGAGTLTDLQKTISDHKALRMTLSIRATR